MVEPSSPTFTQSQQVQDIYQAPASSSYPYQSSYNQYPSPNTSQYQTNTNSSIYPSYPQNQQQQQYNTMPSSHLQQSPAAGSYYQAQSMPNLNTTSSHLNSINTNYMTPSQYNYPTTTNTNTNSNTMNLNYNLDPSQMPPHSLLPQTDNVKVKLL